MRYAAIALLALAACATAPANAPAKPARSDARDCAVLAEVLRAHYKVDAQTRYRLQRGDSTRNDTWFVTCDFAAMGIPVRDYDSTRTDAPGRENFQSWLRMEQPEYPTPDNAIVAAGSLLGPLAGSGVRCFLARSAGAWTLQRCEQAWVS
jgi:hypothetical protein